MGKQSELTGELQAGCVEISAKDGVAFIDQASPLTRLHYFDGKFLRADAFALEQDYHRARTRLSNIAGGWGVVNGFSVALAGSQLQIGAGLAITAAGNFVLATDDFGAALADLIQVATPAPVGGNTEFGDCLEGNQGKFTEGTGLNIYEITVGPVEGLCGNEAVYGKLCESACVSSSQHPYWREGVVLRLRPIGLSLPASTAVVLSVTHLRNRVASAYFAAEPWLTPSALSAAGLASDLWCNPASLYGRDEVVIGLLVRDAGVNRVLDAWSGRRERMDTQARGYWQGRMAMRPWNVFVAQILQFQCQLAGVFDGTGGVIQPPDDCEQLRQLLDKTRKGIDALHQRYTAGTQKILKQFGEKALKKDAQNVATQVTATYADLYEISSQLAKAELGLGALPAKRLLLNAGFVELPPAGYLPVVPGKQDVEEQLGRMFGEGVRLHFYAVRHDEIAHLVEEAQHMERISLTRGLDDPKRIEDVQIFVPDGEVVDAQAAAPGEWWQVDMTLAALSAFDFGLSTSQDNQANLAVAAALRDTAPTATAKGRRAKATVNAAAMSTLAVNTAAAAGAGLTQEQAQARLAELVRSIASRRILGLARTEGREDGSYGFTLTGRLDADDIVTEMRSILAAYPQIDANGTFARQIDAFSRVSLYLAGDIAADPLKLAINASASLSGELAFASVTRQVSGSVTVLFDRPLTGNGTERVVQLTLILVDAAGKATSSRGQVSLFRQGDGDDGEFVMDDAAHDPSTSPNFFDWQSTPRLATLSVLDDDATEAVSLRLMRGMASQPKAAVTGAASLAAATAPRKELLKMYGLAGMPAIDTAIGAAALNTLIAIAEAAENPAFFARARARLFPTLDAPAATKVRAVLDWVMFRRARTLLCCPQTPATQVPPALEAFQVWHISVADAAALAALRDALDRNDPTALAGYDFSRVGVLRYRDESTVAEESEAQIEAMWRQAQPAPQVVLGRYWEQAPTTGQGWQNHFRLTAMLDQIKEITTPPPTGTGAIARLEAVSPPLSDGALDGGFLVVTQGAAITRRALLLYSGRDGAPHYPDQNALRSDQVFVNDQPQGTTLAEFIGRLPAGTTLAGLDLATIKAAPDEGAAARMQSVVAALQSASRPVPSARTIASISDHDRDYLPRVGIPIDGYDEVIFFDSN